MGSIWYLCLSPTLSTKPSEQATRWTRQAVWPSLMSFQFDFFFPLKKTEKLYKKNEFIVLKTQVTSGLKTFEHWDRYMWCSAMGELLHPSHLWFGYHSASSEICGLRTSRVCQNSMLTELPKSVLSNNTASHLKNSAMSNANNFTFSHLKSEARLLLVQLKMQRENIIIFKYISRQQFIQNYF